MTAYPGQTRTKLGQLCTALQDSQSQLDVVQPGFEPGTGRGENKNLFLTESPSQIKVQLNNFCRTHVLHQNHVLSLLYRSLKDVHNSSPNNTVHTQNDEPTEASFIYLPKRAKS
jgi:hypothetical protein